MEGPHWSHREEQRRQGRNNSDIEKYRHLQKKTKEPTVGQIILSGILPVFGTRSQGYINSRRMAAKTAGTGYLHIKRVNKMPREVFEIVKIIAPTLIENLFALNGHNFLFGTINLQLYYVLTQLNIA